MGDRKYQHTFTVFTPTYNREHLLTRVYQSLIRQTFKDFEWLIVDDGSTDNTAEVVASFAKEADFPVRYIWKLNGGVHTAVNEGVRKARGMFFAILDSDDWYVDDALESMLEFWTSIDEAERPTYSGVCGLCAYENREVIGSTFPSDVWDSDDFEAKNTYRIAGDKKGFKCTDIMREFPFPEDVGRFISESVVWNRIGRTYRTRFVNRVFAVVEYQAGGLTDSGRVNAVGNPRAKILLYSELLNCGRRLPLAVSIKSAVNLTRYSLHARRPIRDCWRSTPGKTAFLICLPVAIVLVLRDRYLMAKAADDQHRKIDDVPCKRRRRADQR